MSSNDVLQAVSKVIQCQQSLLFLLCVRMSEGVLVMS